MPEILPCPLLMNRYTNPAFSEDSEGSSHNGDHDNYLDPERDYELINDLRRFIMAKEEEEEETVLEDAHQKQH